MRNGMGVRASGLGRSSFLCQGGLPCCCLSSTGSARADSKRAQNEMPVDGFRQAKIIASMLRVQCVVAPDIAACTGSGICCCSVLSPPPSPFLRPRPQGIPPSTAPCTHSRTPRRHRPLPPFLHSPPASLHLLGDHLLRFLVGWFLPTGFVTNM